MKKVLLFFLAFMLLLTTGCGSEANIAGELTDLMDKVYTGIKDEEKPMMLGNIEVNEEMDNVESFIGTKEIEYEEILASEPMMSSIAHSVVLVRVAEDANVEDVKEAIKTKYENGVLQVEIPKKQKEEPTAHNILID